ncbi:fimbrial biogenesis chaperone [[Pseudomonas] boreopolis]|uniref:fimbrial biogenesis chaperone n=1 Tax=Xanthomonas boreopolis TaxID=86183 RepID=UPI003DA1A920
MKRSLRNAAWLFAAAMGLVQAQAQAGVVVNRTRVIYPANAHEVTVKLSNPDEAPALVQVWLDEGDLGAAPEEAKVPFAVTPPVTRIEPGKAQALRVFAMPGSLPRDRESAYWLNVLEVPMNTEREGDANMLKLAFRTRIKLFYRPDGLAGSADEGPQRLAWALVRSGDGKGMALQVRNPTPYHVSFNELSVQVGGRAYVLEPDMVAPMATATFAIEDMADAPRGTAQVDFVTINDLGGMVPGQASLATAMQPREQ